MKIYIAGKITNEPLEACKAKFAAAENKLRALGAAPVNPFKLGCGDTWTFEQCRPYNFKAIRHCHAIFILSDWETSEGTQAEIREAARLQLNFYWEGTKDVYDDIEDEIKVDMIG